jgi:hypothetical protein
VSLCCSSPRPIRWPKTGANMELDRKTMAAYAQPLTARQVADVVTYLRHPPNPQ